MKDFLTFRNNKYFFSFLVTKVTDFQKLKIYYGSALQPIFHNGFTEVQKMVLAQKITGDNPPDI